MNERKMNERKTNYQFLPRNDSPIISFVRSFVHQNLRWGQVDYYNITSQEILERISRHCPEALSTYLQCVNRADKLGSFFFSKHIIEVEMSEDFRSFRQNIKKLARENLLMWYPIDNGISITLAANDEDE